MEDNNHIEETAEAKLRNLLTPIYSLADIVILMDEHQDLKRIAIDTAKQVIINKEKIKQLLIEIENKK
jgi:hypothetical protein